MEEPARRLPEGLSVPLPIYLTRFVGREQERAHLSVLLLERRLLTLVGAGGIGKTRLAIQVAGEVGASFDRVYLVELAALSDPQLITQTVAEVLAVRTDTEVAPVSLLIAALADRRSLLVFDNCEHVLVACALLIDLLLRSCPHLTILATSREPLDVAGELVWRVGALSTPDPQQHPSLEALVNHDAVQLFCERAAENTHRFSLNAHNAAIIARICHQLDGLPLALELAAALLPVLSVEQIATRLSERFALLTQGKRTAEMRQRSLQATLDWSYVLLTPFEQVLFERVAVFVGSWSLEAAEEIAAIGAPTSHAVLETLARLVNKSLVMAEEQEGVEQDTVEVRYRLLDTMREYALEKLQQTGELPEVYERHSAWYLHRAEEARQHMQGVEQIIWLQRVEVEMANMRAALTRSLAAGELNSAARLVDALLRFWITRNYFSEGRYWCETLLAASNVDQPLLPELRARILFGASEFARYQGAYEKAASLLEEQMVLLRALNDAAGLAEAHTYLGMVVSLQGDYERGISTCQTGLEMYRELGHQQGIAIACVMLSFITLAQGQYQRALTLSEEACRLLRSSENYVHLLYALFTQAQAALFAGIKLQARSVCQEALQLARSQHNTYGIVASLGLIAGLASMEGQHAQAAQLFGAAQALQERIQAPHPPSGRALLERMVISVRAALGKEQFLQCFTAGRTSSLEAMLHLATAFLERMPSAVTSVTVHGPMAEGVAALSPREREILALVATGLTDVQAAEYLRLSPRTVGKHLQSIYSKLHVGSRSAATRFALEHGLV